jgi:hypothetical protein
MEADKKRELIERLRKNKGNDKVIAPSRKIKKQPMKFKIVDIEQPRKIERKESRKRYSIRVKYLDLDGKDPKTRYKSVRFGDKDRKEFIDHKDEALRDKTLKHMKKCSTPFDRNFYTRELLNTGDNLDLAYKGLKDRLQYYSAS